MMKLGIPLIIVLALAGCSAGSVRPNFTPSNTSQPAATPAQSTPSQPTATPTPSIPSTGGTPEPTLQQTAAPTSLPVEGWKTIANPKLNLAMKYPLNWLVEEGSNYVTFTSQSGNEIELAIVNTGALTPQEYLAQHQLPNTRCSSSTNPNGIKLRTCLDTIAFSTTAYFIVPSSQGSSQLLSLTLLNRQDMQVFNDMLDSLKPAG